MLVPKYKALVILLMLKLKVKTFFFSLESIVVMYKKAK